MPDREEGVEPENEDAAFFGPSIHRLRLSRVMVGLRQRGRKYMLRGNRRRFSVHPERPQQQCNLPGQVLCHYGEGYQACDAKSDWAQ